MKEMDYFIWLVFYDFIGFRVMSICDISIYCCVVGLILDISNSLYIFWYEIINNVVINNDV